MASVRAKAQPVGSTEWILDENTQLAHFGAQEIEDFTFAARNEVEWLNEHMKDIFTKSQVDVTEIFKTPGKLRGKTPRTARKRNPLENRQPLTDIFSTNARQAPLTFPTHHHKEELIHNVSASIPIAPPVPVKTSKINTDSGYHGLSEDETDPGEYMDAAKAIVKDQPNGQNTDPLAVPRLAQGQLTSPSTERATTTEGSFHSAREAPNESEDMMTLSESAVGVEEAQDAHPSSNAPPQRLSPERAESAKEDAMDIDQRDDELALDEPIDESNSPSQGSSPFEPIVRKSSLTFASLPAPEPWTTKKSMGARTSRTSHLDQNKNALGRGSYLERFTGGKSLGASKHPGEKPEMEDETDLDGMPRTAIVGEESDGDTRLKQLHNKSSTQRLHDKINMLGKSQTARPTKSIPTNAVPSNSLYPELPPAESQTRLPEQMQHSAPKTVTATAPEDDDDDWIQPPPNQLPSTKRPQLPKSTTADVMEHIRGKQHIGDDEFGPGSYDNAVFQDAPASKQQTLEKAALSPNLARSASAAVLGPSQRNVAEPETYESGSNQAFNPASQLSTTETPAGTPAVKRNADGPISASKSKLQSIMRTARGLFTSSAGVSAQAKMEALSSPTTRSRGKIQEAASVTGKPNEDAQAIKQPEGRKTRSSTEKEEKRKLQEARMVHEHGHSEEAASQTQRPQMGALGHFTKDTENGEGDLKSAQSAKPTRQSPRRVQKQSEVKELEDGSETRASNVHGHTMAPPQVQPSQLQKPKELRRPVKPTKEAASKPKPQTIRVGALSQQRIPLSNSALSSSLQESLPPAQSGRPGLTKKASNASIQTSVSNSSLKSSTSSKPKALIAAERKKEQDEREAQRKLDQKKEIERKRAAQQEEARQQERLQREEAERQRERERSVAAEDPKKAASRQLIEKRRLELARKEQQQRAPQKPQQDSAVPQEKTQAAPATHRPELGGARPPPRLHTVQDHGRPALNHPPTNPARPAIKRVIEPEPEEEPSKPIRMHGGPSYQASENKRRRTGEDEPWETNVRPTMAPPIRQSNIRKELNKQSNYNNYSTAPPPASHHTSTLLKTSTMNQAYQQHVPHQQSRPGQQPYDMAKYGNTRPPFADAPNPLAPAHKTPLPKHLAPPPKASPQFVNGENIHLEDIPTDSDSDDSPDPAKRTMLPDWVQSPELRRLLEEQEKNQNADSIFGPPQTPRMEEMFKDRHQRFRNRTSSANWTASGDRLTEEEKVADREARERVRREGGWTFGL